MRHISKECHFENRLFPKCVIHSGIFLIQTIVLGEVYLAIKYPFSGVFF